MNSTNSGSTQNTSVAASSSKGEGKAIFSNKELNGGISKHKLTKLIAQKKVDDKLIPTSS